MKDKKFNIKEWQDKHLLKEGMWDSDAQAELGAIVANFKNAIISAEADEIWEAYKALDDVVKAYVKEIDPQHPLSLA